MDQRITHWKTVVCQCVYVAECIYVVCRKHSDEADDDVEDPRPAKRERTSHSSKYCHMCKCRLELAVREIGKCKCGMCSVIAGLLGSTGCLRKK